MKLRLVGLLLVSLLSATLTGCGYNTLQSQDEQIKAAWSEVVNQYQRRADLVPNLVNTVKGAAAQERGVLEAVTQARARASSIQATPELLENPQAFAQFQQAQDQLTQALSRLLVTVEAYPELRSIQAFRDLQSQLEGVENRIAVARNRYIAAVQAYNTTVRTFPSNLTAKLFGHKVKPNFTVANERDISTAPTVDFTPPAPKTEPAQPPAEQPKPQG